MDRGFRHFQRDGRASIEPFSGLLRAAPDAGTSAEPSGAELDQSAIDTRLPIDKAGRETATDIAALGIPQEADYIRRYCQRTGIQDVDSLHADWNFYLAYNMFRIAAILQGIAKRVEAGTASSAQARASGAGARPMAELAWSFAQKA